jgi:hypothetical protein
MYVGHRSRTKADELMQLLPNGRLEQAADGVRRKRRKSVDPGRRVAHGERRGPARELQRDGLPLPLPLDYGPRARGEHSTEDNIVTQRRLWKS